MPMERPAKFCSPQKNSGDRQQNSLLLNIWSRWGLVLKWLYTVVSGVIQVSWSPEIQNWSENKLFTPIFKSKIFTVAAQISALADILCEVGAPARPHVGDVVIVITLESQCFGRLGLRWQAAWSQTMCPFSSFLRFLKQVSICFSC